MHPLEPYVLAWQSTTRDVIDLLRSLGDDEWSQPTDCPGWTVHDVLAHMVATAEETPSRFLVGLLTSGFRLSRMTEKRIAVRVRP